MDILLAVVTTLIGIVVSVLVSRHYFIRSLRKELSVFVQFYSKVFSGVDSQLRENLKIEFRSKEVRNLYEIQYVVANTGDRSIHDYIQPLRLKLPAEAKLLDASILYCYPSGRAIELKQFDDGVKFEFDLLNKGDFFIVKCLIDGDVSHDDMTFTVSCDDLPPTIESKSLPLDAIRSEGKRSFSLGSLVAGVVFLIFGGSGLLLSVDSAKSFPAIVDLNLLKFFSEIGLKGIAALVNFIPTAFLGLVGVMMTISGFTDGTFPPPKRMFTVPSGDPILSRSRWNIRALDHRDL